DHPGFPRFAATVQGNHDVIALLGTLVCLAPHVRLFNAACREGPDRDVPAVLVSLEFQEREPVVNPQEPEIDGTRHYGSPGRAVEDLHGNQFVLTSVEECVGTCSQCCLPDANQIARGKKLPDKDQENETQHDCGKCAAANHPFVESAQT